MRKYKIELTENQLSLVLYAINLTMRTGIGQTDDLAHWIIIMGGARKVEEDFPREYEEERRIIQPILKGLMDGCWRGHELGKQTYVNELETIYEAIRHQQYLDSEIYSEYDTRADQPVKRGDEPVPKIERMDDDKSGTK